MKNKEELSKIRKQARKSGKDFEIRVRADLTEKGWTVCRFTNNVEFEEVKDEE